MKGYAKYVEVESRWAKYIPESWTFSNIAEVFIERKENNNPIKTMDILSLTNTRGVIPYKKKETSETRLRRILLVIGLHIREILCSTV